MDEDVTPVVLAGGESRRFGHREKATAEFRGRPLVAHVVDAVGSALPATPLVAVASPSQRDRLDAIVDDVRFVRDGDGAGPVAGLAAAAEHVATTGAARVVAGESWLLAVPCDTPLLSAGAVEWLCGLHRADVGAVVPVIDDRPQPLFALYRTGAVLGAVRDDPPASMRGVLDAVGGAKRAIPRGSLGETVARAVRDVDTVDDLHRLRRRARSAPGVER